MAESVTFDRTDSPPDGADAAEAEIGGKSGGDVLSEKGETADIASESMGELKKYKKVAISKRPVGTSLVALRLKNMDVFLLPPPSSVL